MSTWRISTLGEECELYQPKTVSMKELKTSGEFPVYGANGQIGFYDKFNHEESQVLLSCRGNCGTVNVSQPKSWINGNAMVCAPKTAELSKNYLAYFLQSVDWKPVITGTAQPQITRQPLAKVLITVPPLEKQLQIVSSLEHQLAKLDSALADLEFAAKRTHHLFLAALEKAINECDESTYHPLGDFLKAIDHRKKVQRGWSPQCLSHPQSDPSIWAVLKTTAVQNMRYEPQHNKELPTSLSPKAHLEVQAGDFLMTTTGPRNRCGVVCLVPTTPKRLIFSGKILRFKPDSTRLFPEWLELVLASHNYQKRLDLLKVGSSDSSVSIGNSQVLEIEVPVPSLAEQSRLVGNVMHMKVLSRRFEMEIEQEVQKFSQLRRSLLHQAFRD